MYSPRQKHMPSIIFNIYVILINNILRFIFQPTLRALWRYMHHMYQLDAFTQSCPADQDIINHYKLQQVVYSYLF